MAASAIRLEVMALATQVAITTALAAGTDTVIGPVTTMVSLDIGHILAVILARDLTGVGTTGTTIIIMAAIAQMCMAAAIIPPQDTIAMAAAIHLPAYCWAALSAA